MARRLPSMNALRAFEAAARHLSFTKAAQELFVTQAAISHQIRRLEEQLGTSLFRRLNRRLRLTEAGRALSAPVGEALDLMADGVERLRRDRKEGALTVSTLESIAATWLVPRLANFRARHPEIGLSLEISDRLADFERGNVDMALRYGKGGWANCAAVKLADEEIFPVLAPSLADKGPKLERPRDLLKFPLISEDLPETWEHWFAAAGVPDARPPGGTFLPHSNLVMQAVMAGEGVALGRSFLIAPDIKSGRLIRPFDIAVPASNGYYVAYPDGAGEQPKIKAFADWIVAETRAQLA